MELGLERTHRVLSYLGNPESSVCVLHVAGTNGKGSVVSMLESALLAGGASVCAFVSPFLREPRDSFRLNGKTIEIDIWNGALEEVRAAKAGETTFEGWTAVALLLASRYKVDVLVLEVGLGGARDATNVIPPPLAAIITSLSLDHVDMIGPTLLEIAKEKSGIFKKNSGILVTVPGQTTLALDVLTAAAVAVGGEVTIASKADLPHLLQLGLSGDFQERNAAAAFTVIRYIASGAVNYSPPTASLRPLIAAATSVLADDSALLRKTWATLTVAGRLTSVNLPLPTGRLLTTIIDGGHNVEAMAALGRELRHRCGRHHRAVLVFACGASRNVEENFQILFSNFFEQSETSSSSLFSLHIIGVAFSPPQGMPWVSSHTPEVIIDAAKSAAMDLSLPSAVTVECASTLEVALSLAAAAAATTTVEASAPLVAVCGSLYLVSDIYRTYFPEL